MKRLLRRTYFTKSVERDLLWLAALVVGMVAVASIAGCEEANLSDTKKSRLIAAENIQFKKQLAQCSEELAEQKQLTEKYLKEKKKFQKRASEGSEEILRILFENFDKETIKIREENEHLKSKVEDLEKQLKELEEKSSSQTG